MPKTVFAAALSALTLGLVGNLVLGLTPVPGLSAATAQDWQPAPPPPEMSAITPPPVVDDAARQQQLLEQADIILYEGLDETIKEYWINNQLFMVEVIPAVGPPYYLIDTTGDGLLDSRRERLGTEFVPPQWILFRW